MPDEVVYAPARAEAERIADAVRAVEESANISGRARQRGSTDGGRDAPVLFVRVTGAAVDGKHYPAGLFGYDPTADAWTALGACWAREANGRPLGVNTGISLHARRSGPWANGADSRPVLLVDIDGPSCFAFISGECPPTATITCNGSQPVIVLHWTVKYYDPLTRTISNTPCMPLPGC